MSRDNQDQWLAQAIFSGQSTAEIAAETGLALGTITRIKSGQSRAGVAFLVDELAAESLNRDRNRLIMLRHEALDSLADLMRNAESEQVRCRAAQSIRAELAGLDDQRDTVTPSELIEAIARASHPAELPSLDACVKDDDNGSTVGR